MAPMKARRILLLLLSPLFLGSVLAAGFELSWEPRTVDQGGVVRILVTGPPTLERPTGSFATKGLRFYRGAALGQWFAWAGADLNLKTGTTSLVVKARGESVTEKVPVKAGDYKIEHLTLPEGQVSPRSKQTLDRIWGDRKRAKAAGLHVMDAPFPGKLVVPCQGRKNHNFGKRRILNGKPRSPHGGEDISAPRGTPVRAAAVGEVRLVDDMFFSGKTLFIDHGAGWMSTYFHLDEILVKEGDPVGPDTIVGKVGSTGRATGPHLHWGLQWLRSRVNPLLLVDGDPGP